ncbi:MAG TPA: 5'/3'-nucleotidase SurE [Thermodesulfobacteriota bacterium]|jgi:5'-nucleotidase|nr:5'/3'-nucleotidase SurE [Thermodesulfobacteriota bacterium]
MSARILISNDDGINSAGLFALSEVLRMLGEIFIVAPDRDQSAVSHSLSLYRPLRIEEIAENVYSVDGTPTDCINLAINGLLKDRKPDLIVSGINKGENLGDDITYSGTVSAAMEGTLLGVPSIAVSLATKKDFYFDTASHYALMIAKYVLRRGLPEGTLLNVNIPNLPKEEVKGVKVTRQGKRVYGEPIVENIDPRGKKYYWIGGNDLGSLDIENSDIVAVRQGYVSVTPIKLDLTDYDFLEKLKLD